MRFGTHHLLHPKKLWIIYGFSFLILISLIWFIFLDNTSGDNEYAARINGHPISYNELNQAIISRQNFFEQANQNFDPETLRQNVLQGIIDNFLISKYAEQNNIYVSDDEVNEYFMLRTDTYDSEQQFLDELERLYGFDKNSYLENVKLNLVREKVQNQLGDTSLSDWLERERNQSEIQIY